MIVVLGLQNVFLDIVFSTVLVRSVLECSTVCYGSSKCASLLYDHRNGHCHLCDQIFNGDQGLVSPVAGVNYYQFAPEAPTLSTTTSTTTTTPSTTSTTSTTTTTTPTTTTASTTTTTLTTTSTTSTTTTPTTASTTSSTTSTTASTTTTPTTTTSTTTTPTTTTSTTTSTTTTTPTTTTTTTITTTTPTTTVYAPPGYKYEATISCHYKVHSQKITWNEARSTCQSEGGDLATATTNAQRNFFIGLVNSGEIPTDAFMGGDNKSGTWKWLDGTPATGFTIGYADRVNRCLDLDADHKQFFAESCTDSQIFICEYCSS